MCLDGLDKLVGSERPHDNLTLAGAGKDVPVRNRDSQDRTVMSELLQLVGGGVGAAIVEVAGLQAGHRSGRFFCSARRNVRTSRVLKRVDLCCADCRAQGSESHQID